MGHAKSTLGAIACAAALLLASPMARAAGQAGSEEYTIAGIRLDDPLSRYAKCGSQPASAYEPCWTAIPGAQFNYDLVALQWPAQPGGQSRIVTATVMRGRIASLLVPMGADTEWGLAQVKAQVLQAAGRQWSGWRGPVLDHGRQAWFGPGAIGEIVDSPNAVALMLSTVAARKIQLSQRP